MCAAKLQSLQPSARARRELTRPLSSLAGEIRTEVDAAERDLKSGLAHAIRAGELLTEAKDTCKHGEWLPWLADNFAFTRQTASGYMRLARHRDQMEGTPSIPIDAALKQLAAPRERVGDPRASLADLDAAIARAHELEAECDAKHQYISGGEWLSPPADYLPDDEQRRMHWILGDGQDLALAAVVELIPLRKQLHQLVRECWGGLVDECDRAIAEIERA